MIVTNDNNTYTENSIRTFTGKAFDLKILDPETICIEDIAHGLSNTARFSGHLPKFYSVAQHSVIMAEAASQEYKLEALLHDASEAYMGDMPSPFKKIMPEFKAYENKLMEVIAKKYDFNYPISKHVKYWDKEILQMEWNSFVEVHYPVQIKAWSPPFAKFRFLDMYTRLTSNEK